ncbi:MAG: response regulator transcription factor [Chthonomonadales bacterium]
MQSILIYAPNPLTPPLRDIRDLLRLNGYLVACPDLGGPEDEAIGSLTTAFHSALPDVVLADLTSSRDYLPMLRLGRLMKNVWGDESQMPLRLTILNDHSMVRLDMLSSIDDFILIPFTPEEILVRIRQLLFRRRHVESANELQFADVKVNLVSETAFDSCGAALALRPREFNLLRFLVTHRGKYFTRSRLLDLVWGIEFDGGERTVDIHIRRLRAKLPPSAALLIETHRGLGYRINLSKETR